MREEERSVLGRRCSVSTRRRLGRCCAWDFKELEETIKDSVTSLLELEKQLKRGWRREA
jgi:hypothetical protein